MLDNLSETSHGPDFIELYQAILLAHQNEK